MTFSAEVEKAILTLIRNRSHAVKAAHRAGGVPFMEVASGTQVDSSVLHSTMSVTPRARLLRLSVRVSWSVSQSLKVSLGGSQAVLELSPRAVDRAKRRLGRDRARSHDQSRRCGYEADRKKSASAGQRVIGRITPPSPPRGRSLGLRRAELGSSFAWLKQEGRCFRRHPKAAS